MRSMSHRQTSRSKVLHMLCALSTLPAVCFACLVLALAAGVGRAADARPDLSTPKKAAMAFATALAAGDEQAMRAASTGTDEDFKGLLVLSETLRAMKRFQTAAVKKFGDDAKAIPDMSAAMSRQIEASDEKIDGDTATLVNKDRPDRHPATLRKLDGRWKMDLKSISEGPQFARMKETAAKATKAIDGVTADVAAGKFPTFQDAMRALDETMKKLAS